MGKGDCHARLWRRLAFNFLVEGVAGSGGIAVGKREKQPLRTPVQLRAVWCTFGKHRVFCFCLAGVGFGGTHEEVGAVDCHGGVVRGTTNG